MLNKNQTSQSEGADVLLVVSVQLIEMQKELQKQIITTVANPVVKEGKRLEGFIRVHDLFISRQKFGGYLKINVQLFWAYGTLPHSLFS